MSTRKGTFSGTNVFLSRNLVPPEVFDAIHDALRLNEAQVFLCCDPSRTAPNDYHVISSPDHEKFQDLKAKGCNLIGPQCIFSCAKEHRMLPKHGYTCCLAMDGAKVLASGFERDEKAMIEKLVTAMGGVLQAKTSMDVNFVIVKNVLAAKYKWALHVLKKPIVNMSWLRQCWIEHRVVPQEPYRVLPFMGLTICVTRIPADERKEIEGLIMQNGGQYSADLTKKCSHLVSDIPKAPAGDKYVVAQRWGHIHIVSRKWIDQSISRRACLDERLYPVHEINASGNDAKVLHKEQNFLDHSNGISQFVPPTIIEDLEASSSQYISASETFTKKNEVAEGYCGKMEDKDADTNSEHMEDVAKFDCQVAQDSEEDDDLYLSNCRIFLAGFEEKELRKLVNMIRRGGGTRHMSLNEKLSHIILGTPSEAEKKEVRCLAVWGVINVVNATWLEESDQAKRELPVSSRHIFSALTISKDSTYSCMEPSVADHGVNRDENIPVASFATISPTTEDKVPAFKLLSNEKQGTNGRCSTFNGSTEGVSRCEWSHQHSIMKSNQIDEIKLHSISATGASSNSKATFKGKSFCFSSSFPVEPRAEVIEWVKGGGGTLLDDRATNADFIIECHGLSQVSHASISQSTSISTHWIRSSIEECCMQDVENHILYSPLHCHIPLPGFEGLRFCVSQYEGKERILLRNLCFVLGAKFTEKLTKKVTHLICKFTNGPKYTAACRKGIQTVTAEWIAECVSQDKLVPPDSFRPRPVTLQDKEAGLCTVSQHPTQAAHLISFSSQSQSQPQGLMQNSRMNVAISSNSKRLEDSSSDEKRLKLLDLDRNTRASKRKKVLQVQGENCQTGPDVADAIEDLLAQSDKIQDLKSPGMSSNESNVFVPDPHGNSNTASGISNNWSSRPEKQDSTFHPTNQARKSGPYETFTETQTESQVVGYEEDLTGRQKIIERVRSQSVTMTPDVRESMSFGI